MMSGVGLASDGFEILFWILYSEPAPVRRGRGHPRGSSSRTFLAESNIIPSTSNGVSEHAGRQVHRRHVPYNSC